MDEALDDLGNEDDDLGRIDDEDGDEDAEVVGPIGETVEETGKSQDDGPSTDPKDMLAALFSGERAGVSVRAWNVSRPGTPAVWERAQMLRSQRAEALAAARAQRIEASKPNPIAAASARSSAIEARSSTV